MCAIAPLSKGLQKEALHYFSAKKTPVGSLVSIPLRGKLTLGIVLESSPLEKEKSAVRRSSAPLKKISKIIAPSYLSPLFIESVRETTLYHASTLPATLSLLLPSEYTNNVGPYPALTSRGSSTAAEVQAVQDGDAERYAYYKRLVREAFARKHSLVLIVPTIADLTHAHRELSRGISEHVFTLYSTLSGKEFEKNARALLSAEQPTLLIASPIGLPFLRSDADTVIIDRESAPSYKMITRPFIDVRVFARALCVNTKIRLILGDILLRTETLHEIDRGSIIPAAVIKYRITTKAQGDIIDMRAGERAALSKKEKGRAISKALASAITETLSRKGRAVLLTARKGLAPTTVCSDCGETILCPHCSSPFVLHRAHGEFVYACHRCGHSEVPPESCPSCGSWKLTLLGMGIEKSADELSLLFPNTTLLRIDSDVTSGKQSVQKTIDEFYATSGSILLCTELALPYLSDPVELTGVISVDSLLVIADFRMHHRIMSLLVRLRGLANDRFIIETRDALHPLFTRAITGALIEFYRNDSAERERFHYPPYSVLIKIARTGRRDAVLDDMEELMKALKEYTPTLYASYESAVRGLVTMNMLIPVPPARWPENELLQLLRSLPPDFTVDVDPVNIL